jgi:hypothetical protein
VSNERFMGGFAAIIGRVLKKGYRLRKANPPPALTIILSRRMRPSQRQNLTAYSAQLTDSKQLPPFAQVDIIDLIGRSDRR